METLKKKIHYDIASSGNHPLTGKEITIALLDSGVSPHPDLVPQLTGWMDCVNRKQYIYDDNGHGTHVACWKHEIW